MTERVHTKSMTAVGHVGKREIRLREKCRLLLYFQCFISFIQKKKEEEAAAAAAKLIVGE